MLAQIAGVPMPAQWLYEAAARKDTELAAVERLLADRATTLRLVAEPGPAAEDALGRARTGIALHGLRVDTLVANRVLPRHSSDPWFADLAARQDKCLDLWRAGPEALTEVPHLGRDPRTADDLAPLGAHCVPDERTPGPAPDPWWTEDTRDEPGGDALLTWCLPLPGAVKEELRLVRRGDELLLTAGSSTAPCVWSPHCAGAPSPGPP